MNESFIPGFVTHQPGGVLAVLVDSQLRPLHDVLGFGNAAEHPVGDRKGRGSPLLEFVFVDPHRSSLTIR